MARRSFFRGFPGFRLPPPLPTATATPPLQSRPCLQLLTEFSQKTPGQAPPAQIPAVLAIANGVFEKQTDCTQGLSRTPRVLYLFQFCLRKTQSALSGFLARCATHFYPTAPPHVLSSRGLGGFRWWIGTLWPGAFLHRRGRFRRQRLGL